VTTADREPSDVEMCPYWHEIAGDFMAMYPAGGYCIAGCHKRVKVMANSTVERVCAMHFSECEGYQRLLAEDDALEQGRPRTLRR
jgi:hypothetical protein